jgi:hypothetical protein
MHFLVIRYYYVIRKVTRLINTEFTPGGIVRTCSQQFIIRSL